MPETESLDQLDGRGLRARLEETLESNRRMQDRLVELEATTVLTGGGFDLVKPDDLKGVAPDKIKSTAEALQAERLKVQESLLRDALEKRGFKGEEIDEMVGEAQSSAARDRGDAQTLGRMRNTVSGGEVVPVVNTDKLHGYDAIKAAIEQQEARAARRR